MTFLRLCLPVLSWLVFLRLSAAALMNATVDDSQTDLIQYSPQGVWWTNATESDGIMPNASLAQGGTWHFGPNFPTNSSGNAANTSANITFKFNGSAVNVFAILQREVLTAVNISINGTAAGNFSSMPESSPPFIYNVSIFSNSSLPPGEHTLVLSPSGTDTSWICLDYIVYSQDIEQSSKPLPLGGADVQATPPPPPSITSGSLHSSSPLIGPSAATETSSPLPEISSMSTAPPSPDSTPSPFTTSLQSPKSTGTTSAVGAVTETTVSTAEQSATPQSASLSSKTLAIVLGSSVGGILFLCALLLGCLFYRRARQTRVFRIDPFTTPDPSPSWETEFVKTPNSATSSHPFLARLSFQTIAESAGSTITLTDEIFPLPSEVDDVYNQLEALSAEVRRLRNAEEKHLFKRLSTRRAPARSIQAGIDQLRADVQRLRHRSGSPSSGDHSTSQRPGDTDPLAMLRDLAFLRGEIEELLVEQNMSEVERLPSYHSRRAGHVHDPQIPPPLPQQYLAKDTE